MSALSAWQCLLSRNLPGIMGYISYSLSYYVFKAHTMPACLPAWLTALLPREGLEKRCSAFIVYWQWLGIRFMLPTHTQLTLWSALVLLGRFSCSDLTLPFVKRLKCSFACCTPLEQPFFFAFIFIFPSPEIVMLNGFSVSVSSGCCCCRWAPLALTRGYFIIY